MELDSFPNIDRGELTLCHFVKSQLKDPKGRKLLRELVEEKVRITKKFTSGVYGYQDAIDYFQDGILTEEMEQVLIKLGLYREAKQNKSPNSSAIKGSILGFKMGVAFSGEDELINLSLNNGRYNKTYQDLMQIVIDCLNLYQDYDSNYILKRYKDRYNLEEEKTDKLPDILIRLFKIEGEYSERFQKVFKLDFAQPFDQVSKIRGYGGCLARVVPIAYSMKVDVEIADVWMTDPYLEAFRAVHYIVSVLRCLYLNEEREPKWKFNDKDIYSKTASYVDVFLKRGLDKTLKLIFDEDQTDREIILPVVFAVFGAQETARGLSSDIILRANLIKIK